VVGSEEKHQSQIRYETSVHLGLQKLHPTVKPVSLEQRLQRNQQPIPRQSRLLLLRRQPPLLRHVIHAQWRLLPTFIPLAPPVRRLIQTLPRVNSPRPVSPPLTRHHPPRHQTPKYRHRQKRTFENHRLRAERGGAGQKKTVGAEE
jgi:hypothetical protein